jgi:hypothetical protein
MSRWWTAWPLVAIVAVPIWTAPSAAVVAIEAVAVLLCIFGICRSMTGPATAGCVVAAGSYALALVSAPASVDVVGAAVFGLALLFLLDLSEFARRFGGATIAPAVMRAQTGFWLGRATAGAGAVAALTVGGLVVSLVVPGSSRAVVAGLGAVFAFAGSLYAGIIRRPGA